MFEVCHMRHNFCSGHWCLWSLLWNFPLLHVQNLVLEGFNVRGINIIIIIFCVIIIVFIIIISAWWIWNDFTIFQYFGVWKKILVRSARSIIIIIIFIIEEIIASMRNGLIIKINKEESTWAPFRIELIIEFNHIISNIDRGKMWASYAFSCQEYPKEIATLKILLGT